MRLMLFDWTTGGHHGLYLQRFAEALAPSAQVVAAVADPLAGALEGLPVDVVPLGPSRPLPDPSRPPGPQNRDLADAELDLLRDAVARERPDHVLHLNGDPILRRLVRLPPLPTRVSLCLFRPRAHFPSAYDARLEPRERLRAWFLEGLVARWRRRCDAHALLTLDEEAARRWSRRAGAPAVWFPEPPVQSPPWGPADIDESDCVLYGALAPRKGIDLLAAAIALGPTPLRMRIAGAVEEGFEAALADSVAAMRLAGADVDLRDHHHAESDGLGVLAAARCAVLPYPQHLGMSRVLVEAAAVGTPVLVHDFGMLGHLVRRHGIGRTVDCTDSAAFRAALLEFASVDRRDDYEPALAAFAARFSSSRFRWAVTAPFAGTPSCDLSADDRVFSGLTGRRT
jgi:glycosyltransferase involved in cell wall biosynthesis